MQMLITSCLAFLLCYFTLRYLKLFWEKQTLPSWSRFFLGILAWGTFLGFLGMLAGGLFLVYLVTFQGNFGIILALIALGLGVGLIAKYANANPELFDFQSMKPFLKDSLAFADPTRRRENIFDDLDRHEIRRVYKEVSGRDFSAGDAGADQAMKTKLDAAGGPKWAEDRRVTPRKELRDELSQPIASPHLHMEIGQLKRGESTDFTDSWKINTLKKSFHEFFSLVTSAAIAFPEKRLRLHIEGEVFTKQRLQKSESLYRLKQDLYEFLQAAHAVPWMEPYLRYADIVECTCVHLEVDAFSGIARTPLLMVEISCSDLVSYADRYFNAGELKTTLLVGSDPQ